MGDRTLANSTRIRRAVITSYEISALSELRPLLFVRCCILEADAANPACIFLVCVNATSYSSLGQRNLVFGRRDRISRAQPAYDLHAESECREELLTCHCLSLARQASAMVPSRDRLDGRPPQHVYRRKCLRWRQAC